MKLIKIALAKDEFPCLPCFEEILYTEFKHLQDHDLCFHIELREEKEWHYFCCQFWPRYEHTADTFDIIFRSVSCCIAEYIVKYKEKEVLKEILHQEYGFTDEQEWDAVIDFTLSLLNMDEHGQEQAFERERRLKDRIAEKAVEHFMLENQLSMDGFIRFRLKEQWEEWRQAVQHGMEEYLMDKEYRDFIGILRGMVSNQRAKYKLLHILHVDDQNLLLFNESWERVYSDLVNGVSMKIEGKQANYEDIMIHTLIMAAPNQLVIHTQMESHNIIYTIKRIFEERVQICSHCTKCVSMSNELRKIHLKG